MSARSRIDAVLGWILMAVGFVHVLATFRLRPQLDPRALWFLSGGLAMLYQGALNVVRVRYGAVAPGLRWVSAAANLAGLAFALAMIRQGGGPRQLSWLSGAFVGVLVAAAALSLWPARRDDRAGRAAGEDGSARGPRAVVVGRLASAGGILIAIALLHTAVGLWFGSGPVLAIAREGFLASVDPHRDRQLIFWFLIFGAPMLLIGQLALWMQARGLRPPRFLGIELLAVAIGGALLMPISGFWLVLVPAALLLRTSQTP